MCGPVGAPLAVLVHGMMEAGSVWEPLLPRLAATHRCVVLDLPWNGLQSGLWGRVLPPERWLSAALERFQLCPDVWIAHSFGANTVLTLLAQHPATPGATAPAALVSPFYKALHREVTWSLFQQHVNAFPDFVQQSIRARTARPLAPDVLQRMTRTACEHFGCYVWTEFWRLYAGMPFLPLHEVRQPLLVLAGGDDQFARLPDVRAMVDTLPAGRLRVFRDAGHFLLNDLRHDAVGAIAQFLQVRGDPMPATPRQACAGATPSFHSTESTP
ncbi:2-succinyl-6-hydroxy-2,4-cyclohexadiene-1-carboxylate synthase [compost metagenome]